MVPVLEVHRGRLAFRPGAGSQVQNTEARRRGRIPQPFRTGSAGL